MNTDQLKAYLLHQMTEEDRSAFEEQWAGDPAVFQELRAMEAELFDAYVRGELAADVRARVEKYLLKSEGQRQKLDFARQLQQIHKRPRQQTPRWAMTLAATLVMGCGGTAAWLAWQNASLRAQLGSIAKEPVKDGTELPSLAPAPYASLLLQPGTRDARPPATIARGSAGSAMPIALALEPGDQNGTFSITVTRGAETILTVAPIRAEEEGGLPVASFWIGAQLLPPGDYVIRLSSAATSGAGAPIDYYSMRVIQRSP